MKRREMLQRLGSTSVLGLFSNVLSTQTWAQDVRPFTVRGSGPALIVFDRQPRGFYEQLTDRYRVVVITDPSADNSPVNIASLTAVRLCADILAVADAAHVDRFAWFGFSFGHISVALLRPVTILPWTGVYQSNRAVVAAAIGRHSRLSPSSA